MRRDELYLVDMIESCRHVRSFLVDVDIETWSSSELVRSAVLQSRVAAAIDFAPGRAVRCPVM